MLAKPEAGEIAFTVGRINIDEIKGGKFDGLDATFVQGSTVVIVVPEITGLDFGSKIVERISGLELGEDRCARISGALGAVPDFEIVRIINFGLAGFGFGFLETENVRLMSVDQFGESTFFEDRAEAVDIPRINLHKSIIS